MELTGKCKEEFEKWFKATYCFMGNMQREGQQFETDEQFISKFEHFNISPSSMQYGVYVDFFDSVGIGIVSNTFTISNETSYNFDIYHNGGYLSNREALKDVCKMRSEARTAAIEKANELFNERS